MDLPRFRLRIFLVTIISVPTALTFQFGFSNAVVGLYGNSYDFAKDMSDLLLFVWVFGMPIVAAAAYLVVRSLNPLYKFLKAVTIGEDADDDMYFKARLSLERLPTVIVLVNVLGFGPGFILDVIVDPQTYATYSGIFDLATAVCLAGVCSTFQINMSRLILQPVRLQLNVFEIRTDKGEKVKGMFSSKGMQSLFLSLWFLVSVLFVVMLVQDRKDHWIELRDAVAAGTISAEDAAAQEYDKEQQSVWPPAVPKEQFTLESIHPNKDREALIYVIATLVFASIGFSLFMIYGRIEYSQLRRIREGLSGIAHGKAGRTEQLPITSYDEIGLLVTDMNRALEAQQKIFESITRASRQTTNSSRELLKAIDDVGSSSEEMVASVRQIAKTTESQMSVVEATSHTIEAVFDSVRSINDQIDTQASFVEQTSSSITEMASSIDAVTHNLGTAAEVATGLKTVAQDGGGTVLSSLNAMKDIESSVKDVQKIVSGIEDIASQTNILSMNAAIEAAHAGDAGMGFGVVAKEIRNLATNSSQQAQQILNQIKGMVATVGQGAKLSGKAGDALQRIESDVNRTTGLIHEISFAMQEQNSGVKEILGAIASVVGSSEEIRTMARDLSDRNESMRKVVGDLIAVFREILGATREQEKANHMIMEAVARLREVSSNTQNVVSDLERLTGG